MICTTYFLTFFSELIPPTGNMYIEEQLLEDLKSEKSVFKFIPDNIGDIIYCDSSNPKECPDTKEENRKKITLSISIPCAIIAFCWLVFNESPIFDTIVTVVMLLILRSCLKKCLSFKGTDYFVGTKGMAEITFDKSRDNIVSKNINQFSEFDDLVTGETLNYQNRSYVGTDYYFRVYGHQKGNERSVIASIYSSYNQEKIQDYYQDPIYRFWKKIEMSWGRFKLDQLRNALDNGEKISFNLYTDDNFYNDYFQFQGTQLTIGGTLYEKSTVKNIGFSNGNLVVEHTNHHTNFFGFIEKGNKETIPLKYIGNRELFLTFFKYFVTTL